MFHSLYRKNLKHPLESRLRHEISNGQYIRILRFSLRCKVSARLSFRFSNIFAIDLELSVVLLY